MNPPSDFKTARKQLGLRQTDIANRAGCVVSLVSMVEHGYRPSAAMRERLGAAAGASAGHFWPEDRA